MPAEKLHRIVRRQLARHKKLAALRTVPEHHSSRFNRHDVACLAFVPRSSTGQSVAVSQQVASIVMSSELSPINSLNVG